MPLFNTIVISGKSNVGKTTSIGIFIEELIVSKNIELEYLDKNRNGDFCCSFHINGKRIGVVSIGDKREYISNSFKKIGICDYYICASHLYGDTIDAIIDLKDEYKIVNPLFIHKKGINSKDAILVYEDNNIFTKQLLFLFFSMINDKDNN